MKDPDRLFDQEGSLGAKLLGAIDEPAPPELLERTLTSLGATAAAPLAVSSSASSVSAKVVVAAGAKVAGGGIASAIGGGILAGVVLVGAVHGVGGREEQSPARVASAASLASASPSVASTALVPTEPPVSAREDLAPRDPEPKARAVASSPVRTAPDASASAKGRAVSLAAELALLDEARRALDARDTTRARLVMDRYAREVPHGQLAREAAVLRAEIDRPASSSNP